MLTLFWSGGHDRSADLLSILNQVEASFLKEHDAYGNMTKMYVLINEFIKGREGNLSKDDEMYVNETKDKLRINEGWSFLGRSRQICRNLFISVSFRGKYRTWNQIQKYKFGPDGYPTDFGWCCWLVPHWHLKRWDEGTPKAENYNDLEANALHGENNGVDIVLDAEQFNYAFHHNNDAGFKIALHFD